MGQTVTKFNGEGCQAMNELDWVGKVVGFKGDKVEIQIIIYNKSYGDIRDKIERENRGEEVDGYEIYTYPFMSGDLQCVEGVWVLFT